MENNILLCPVCFKRLKNTNKILTCDNGHCYDISKYGYVNLLLANQKNTKQPGDDKQMVDARYNFLKKGYFDKLRNLITKTVDDFNVKTILDAGCGTGYYLELFDNTKKLIGIDISKHAITYVAKGNKNVTSVVASIFKMPIQEHSIDLILNIFSPKPLNEFKRVLSEDGKIIEVVPGEDHLKEIKKILFVDNFRQNEKKFAFKNFELERTLNLKYSVELNTQEDIVNLIKMTPYWYKGGEKNLNNFAKINKLRTTMDFIINVWR